MRGIRTLALVLVGAMVIAGAGRAMAQDIKVIDEKTVVVRASGVVDSVKNRKKREAMAFQLAKQNAVLLVVNNILRDDDARARFEKVKDQILNDADLYIQNATYKHKGNYDKPLYQTTVTLDVTINKDILEQKLVSLGVIMSAEEAHKELNRFTIMPYLDVANSSPEAVKYKDLFYTRVRVYFQDQNIPTVGEDEIKAIESDEQVLAMAKSSSGEQGQEDLVLQLARNTPADVVVKITAQIETGTYGGATTKKVILTVGAYNALTGEFIGSGQGFSQPLALSSEGASVGAGIDEAMNNAMNTVMDSITNFWRDYTKNGRPIKLIFTDFSFGDMRWIHDALKKDVNDQKRLKAAGNVSEYMVWYNGTPEDLMYTLYDVFQAHQVPLKGDPEMVSNTVRFYHAPK